MRTYCVEKLAMRRGRNNPLENRSVTKRIYWPVTIRYQKLWFLLLSNTIFTFRHEGKSTGG